MVMPSPYLKVEKSAPVMDPLAVRLTFGATSLIMHAEVTPLLPTFALMVPKLANPLYAPPTANTSHALADEWVVLDARLRSGLTLYITPTLNWENLFADVTLVKSDPLE